MILPLTRLLQLLGLSTAVLAQLPSPPAPVTVTNNCTSIRLSWSPVSQAVDYYVRRNTVNNQTTAATIACHQPNFYVDSNVSSGTTYYYWVGSNNGISGCGNGPPGAVVSGMLLSRPAAPGGVSASTGACGRVTVVWTPVPAAATGYDIYRNTSSSSSSATRIGASTTSPFDDTTIQAGRTYYYWIKSTNTCGSSGYSSGASGSSAPSPSVPSGVAATDGTSCTAITVSWTAAANAAGYEVHRNSLNSATGRVLLGMAASSPFQDTTAQRGATYYYWVRSTNPCANSSYSTPDSGFLGICGVVQAYGSGCGLPALTLQPNGSSRPVIGQGFVASIGNVASGVAFMNLGFSNTTMGPLRLPVSLGGVGMTGCQLLQSAEINGGPCPLIGAGLAQHFLPIPNSATFIGMRVYQQAMAIAPGQNAMGIVVSNGLALQVGNL